MKETYTEESWDRFKELNQKATKRLAIAETRAQNNEDKIAALEPRVEKLEEFADDVNDIMHGTNIVKGTRDFRIGTEKFGTTLYTFDGFYDSASSYTYSKDDEGFTIATGTRSGSGNRNLNVLSSLEFEKDDVFTISFDVRFDDISSYNVDFFAIVGIFDSTQNTNISTNANLGFSDASLSKDSVVPDKWYHVVYQYKTLIGKTDTTAFRFCFSVGADGTISYRKLMIQKGHIKNPVWSPAPSDLAMGSVNDITTGMNLLRSTRDFRILTTKNADVVFGDDGWAIGSGFERVIDNDGFTCLYTKSSTPDSYSSIIKGVKNGDVFTAYFYCKFDDPTKLLNNNYILARIYIRRTTGTSDSTITTHNITVATGGLDINDLKPDTWYIVKMAQEISTTEKTVNIGLSLRDLSNSQAGIYYKMPGMVHGKIEHPEWSDNPFDYASSYDWNNGTPSLLGIVPESNLIPENANLDDYKTPGTYASGNVSQDIIKAIKNKPVDDGMAFKLYVDATKGQSLNYLIQRYVYFGQTATEYIRYYQNGQNNNQWYPWRQTYANTTVRPLEGGGTGTTSGIPSKTVIPANTDLNTLQDEGIFFNNGTTDTQTYKNCPVRSPFTMFVVKTSAAGASGAVIQFILSSLWGAYYRTYTSNTWTKWELVTLSSGFNPYNPGLYSGMDLNQKFIAERQGTNIANVLASRVSQGNFEGINIGDYVDIACTGTTRRYVVAAIDPFYQVGNTTKIGHHIVMVPNNRWVLTSALDGEYCVVASSTNNIGYIYWNTTDTNNGTATEQAPYMASNLHKWESEVAIKQFPQEWQDVMLDRWEKLEVRYSSSASLTDSNGVIWRNMGKLWSPSENEVFGTTVVSSRCPSSDNVQFPLFQKAHRILDTGSFWLRNPQSGSSTAAVAYAYQGGCNVSNAKTTGNSPFPCFMIG